MHTELLCAGGEPPAILVRLCDVRTLPPTPVLIEKAERLIPAEEVFSALRYRQDPDKRMALASRLLQQQLLRQHSSRHRDSRAVCSPSFLSDAQPSHASQRRSLSHTLSCNSKAPQQHEILSSAPAASSPPLSSPSPCAASPYSSSATSGSAAAFSAAPSACISVDSAAAPPPLASSASALSGAPSQVCSAASSADSCAHLSANGASHPALSVAGGTRPLNVPEKVERQRSGQKPLWLPRLGEESPFVHFNVSHDNSLVVLAASRLLVGVDCMQLKVRGAANRSVADFLRAMRTQCVGRERAYVFGEGDALPESEQLMRFMKLWTMKEAFVKAIGTGMYVDPERLECVLPDFDSPADGDSSVLAKPTRTSISQCGSRSCCGVSRSPFSVECTYSHLQAGKRHPSCDGEAATATPTTETNALPSLQSQERGECESRRGCNGSDDVCSTAHVRGSGNEIDGTRGCAANSRSSPLRIRMDGKEQPNFGFLWLEDRVAPGFVICVCWGPVKAAQEKYLQCMPQAEQEALRLAIRKRSSQPQTDYSRYSPQVSSLQNSENPSEEDAGESCTYTGRFPFPRFDVRWVSTEALLHPFAPGS